MPRWEWCALKAKQWQSELIETFEMSWESHHTKLFQNRDHGFERRNLSAHCNENVCSGLMVRIKQNSWVGFIGYKALPTAATFLQPPWLNKNLKQHCGTF